MTRLETDHGVQHASIRIYIFDVTYQSQSWLDDPKPLLDILKNACDHLTDLTYKTIKLCGVRKTLSTTMEIHIDGVEYNGTDRLNATEIDILRIAIGDMLNAVQNLTYTKIDVVSDKFLDHPTDNYILYGFT